MDKLKRLLIISLLTLSILLVGLFSFLWVWGWFMLGINFEKLGTVYIMTIIWMVLILSTLISALIDNVEFLKWGTPKRHVENYNLSDFELRFKIKMDFLKVFNISLSNTLKEPIFYLFAGILVLPLFQDKEFIEPFNIINVIIIILSLGLGIIILSFLNSFLNYNLTYGSGKELELTISHMGLFFKDKRSTRHLAWSRIKKIYEDDLFLIFRVNRLHKIYILKDLFDKTDMEKIRKYLT